MPPSAQALLPLESRPTTTRTAYKLIRVRADGSLGPLFINRRQRLPIGEWMPAESHPTKGFALRPGWHCCGRASAPHLNGKREKRQWFKVEIADWKTFDRPEAQGGRWLLARHMRIIEPAEADITQPA
jgi:hypothetical protein